MVNLVVAICWILAAVAYVPYLISAVAGRTTPHPITWALYAVTTGSISAIQWSAGSTALAVATAAMTAGCIAIAAVSIRNGFAVDKVDWLLAIAALSALVVWLFADRPLLSVILLVTADTIATVPTIRASWRDPWGEPFWVWSVQAARNAVSLLAITVVTAIAVTGPVVLTIANGAVAVTILLSRMNRTGHVRAVS